MNKEGLGNARKHESRFYSSNVNSGERVDAGISAAKEYKDAGDIKSSVSILASAYTENAVGTKNPKKRAAALDTTLKYITDNDDDGRASNLWSEAMDYFPGELEITEERGERARFRDITSKISPVVLVVIGFLLLPINITGNVIGNLNGASGGFFGSILIVLGLVLAISGNRKGK